MPGSEGAGAPSTSVGLRPGWNPWVPDDVNRAVLWSCPRAPNGNEIAWDAAVCRALLARARHKSTRSRCGANVAVPSARILWYVFVGTPFGTSRTGYLDQPAGDPRRHDTVWAIDRMSLSVGHSMWGRVTDVPRCDQPGGRAVQAGSCRCCLRRRRLVCTYSEVLYWSSVGRLWVTDDLPSATYHAYHRGLLNMEPCSCQTQNLRSRSPSRRSWRPLRFSFFDSPWLRNRRGHRRMKSSSVRQAPGFGIFKCWFDTFWVLGPQWVNLLPSFCGPLAPENNYIGEGPKSPNALGNLGCCPALTTYGSYPRYTRWASTSATFVARRRVGVGVRCWRALCGEADDRGYTAGHDRQLVKALGCIHTGSMSAFIRQVRSTHAGGFGCVHELLFSRINCIDCI